MKYGYARVSTREQLLDLQLDALNRAGCDRIFQDHGVSGSKASRPGLDELLATVKEGDSIVIWRIDRLGRNTVHTLQLEAELSSRGVTLISETEGIDSSTKAGKFTLGLMALLAEHERNIIVERTVAGLDAAKARGVKLGRPGKFTSKDVDSMIVLRNGGQSVAHIAKTFNTTRDTIYKCLKERNAA